MRIQKPKWKDQKVERVSRRSHVINIDLHNLFVSLSLSSWTTLISYFEDLESVLSIAVKASEVRTEYFFPT